MILVLEGTYRGQVLFQAHCKVGGVGLWTYPVLISLVSDRRVVASRLCEPPDWLPALGVSAIR